MNISSSLQKYLESESFRMRDNLALMLFNTKNVYLAGECEHYEFFVFLFILVVLLEIIQSKTLTIESRRDLCKVVYYSMKAIKDNSIDAQRARKNSKKNVCFVDTATYKRIINNLLCYSFAFKYYGENISTSRLSSHPLELVFGLIRQGSRGNDTAEAAERIISYSQIRDDFRNDLGKKRTHARGRCVIAGSTPSDGWNIDLPSEIELPMIPIEIIALCNKEMTVDDFKSSNVWALASFLDENSPTDVPNVAGNNSGSNIFCRLVNYERK